jgi:hypothetical protein
MKPPRNVCSYPRRTIRLVTLMNGTMRIVPPWKRVQGISRREWLRIKVTIPNLYALRFESKTTHATHRPTAKRVVT